MSEEKQTQETPASVRRRKWILRLSVAAGSLLLLAIIVVFVLPSPLARYVISSQLEELGVEHDGIETVDIDLWNSEVRAGPILFRSGSAPQGQIGETGFDYNFGAIFQGRAFIQTFYLRGLDLYVSRLDSGAVVINGLNLQEVGGGEAEEPEPEPSGEEDGFAFGVESFEFSESRLIFEDLSGGSLTIEVSRLSLQRLLTWTPEAPTTFSLTGRLNEIGLQLDGTLLPLTDPLRLTLDTQFRGVTLERVARFVGETGLIRQEGTLDADVSYDYSIHKSGLVEGKISGTYRLQGLGLETPEGDILSLAKASLDVGMEQSLQPDGSLTALGQLSLEGSGVQATTAAGDSLSAGTLALNLEDLDLVKSAKRRERLLAAAQSGGENPAARAPTIIELMLGWARDLGESLLEHEIEVEGHPRLTIGDARLATAEREGAAAQSLAFDSLSIDLGSIATQTYDKGADAKLGLQAEVTGLGIGAGGGSSAALETLTLASQEILLSVTDSRASLSLDLDGQAGGLSARGGGGAAVTLQSLGLSSAGFSIVDPSGSGEGGQAGEARGPISVRLSGLDASLPGAAGETSLSGRSLSVDLAPFSLSGEERIAAEVSGKMALDGIVLTRGGDEPLSFSLESKRSSLSGVRFAPLGPEGRLTGDNIAIELSGIKATSGSGEDALSLELESLSNNASGIEGSGFSGGELSLSLANDTRAGGLTIGLPLAAGDGASLSISSIALPLSELSAEPDGGALTGALEVGGIGLRTGGENAQEVDIASISLTGLTGGSQEGVTAEALDIGRVAARLRLPEAAVPAAEPATGNEQAAAQAASSSETGGAPAPVGLGQPPLPIKLGSVTLAPGSSIEIVDANHEPPFQANIRIDDLTLRSLDTANPATRSEVTLTALLNEQSRISLNGWASPFKENADFELSSQVEVLPLPFLSPYAEKAVGVNVESGSLNATLDAAASQEGLTGNIGLRIDSLFVAPISPEEAERLKANVGLPVGFAVGVLKDGDGVIDLTFPVSGSLAKPEVDYSDAINKAVSGAMASLFPTGWFSEGGNSFDMEPATFEPGGVELTEEGRQVADHFGALFSERPALSIRACGRAGRADLIALRGAAGAPPETEAAEEQGPEAAAAQETEAAPEAAPEEELSRPNEEEVQALLALATQRGQAVRQYLQSEYGIDPVRVPECRTTYSIDDGEPPRAEFQF